MEETSKATIKSLLKRQKEFFFNQQTKDVKFRIKQLKLLKNSILKHQTEIEKALWEDLHKSPEEAYLTEISIVISEIKHHIKNLRQWAKPKRVSTPLHLLPSSSKLLHEPLGVSLIIGPWNYPFQLLLNPLVGAISSGCCSILKPSPSASATAKILEKIIEETFDAQYIAIVQGAIETNTILINEKFDLIFFTGSSRVGKIIMEAAAKNLVPVVLELGGKSPCIVDRDANIEIAARRIIWGKLINAGQTCIAPDYLFVHQAVKEQLLQKIIQQITKMYGKAIQQSRYYGRIINDQAFERLEKIIKEGTVYYGGVVDKKDKYIEPTILENVSFDDLSMQEEIFGPILPVLSFSDLSETINYIKDNEKPLAFYYFGKNKKAKQLLQSISAGGVCINDTIMHIANHNLPFGGVGNSGMGYYHGKNSFEAFSHKKGVLTTPTWIDLPFKYVPYKYFKWIKKII